MFGYAKVKKRPCKYRDFWRFGSKELGKKEKKKIFGEISWKWGEERRQADRAWSLTGSPEWGSAAGRLCFALRY